MFRQVNCEKLHACLATRGKKNLMKSPKLSFHLNTQKWFMELNQLFCSLDIRTNNTNTLLASRHRESSDKVSVIRSDSVWNFVSPKENLSVPEQNKLKAYAKTCQKLSVNRSDNLTIFVSPNHNLSVMTAGLTVFAMSALVKRTRMSSQSLCVCNTR